MGSFTTPTCDQGVRWYIWRHSQPVSASQLEFFTSHWAEDEDFAGGRGNNRKTQDINSRVVFENKEDDDSSSIWLSASLALLVLHLA